VMAFNPDEPHDGRAAADGGFTYRIVHIGPDLVLDVLSDVAGRSIGLPLFVAPVLPDAELAQALRRLHAALVGGTRLRRDETLSTVVAALVRRGTQARGIPGRPVRRDDGAAARVRALLADSYADDLSAADLARVVGLSRFETSRRFRAAYGVPPSEYQRLLRLRMARRLLAAGSSAAEAASDAGFADQSHLTRWFRRVYGITPAAYQRAGRQTGAA
jgi:AraC-like DNA-binding protein